ncbi:MAG: Holliday junction branch migration protein RuvA [Bacteroidia bacterium]
MIAFVEGKVAQVYPHGLVLKVGDIGLFLRVPLSLVSSIQAGLPLRLHTVLILPREEGEPVLYGFREEEEKKLFLNLLRVPRLGPQRALHILSTFSVEQFLQLLQAEDIEALSRVRGIGKKLAQQVLLELKPLLKQHVIAVRTAAYGEAYEALLALGLTAQEAHHRLAKALQLDPSANAITLIQLALKSS